MAIMQNDNKTEQLGINSALSPQPSPSTTSTLSVGVAEQLDISKGPMEQLLFVASSYSCFSRTTSRDDYIGMVLHELAEHHAELVDEALPDEAALLELQHHLLHIWNQATVVAPRFATTESASTQ